MVCKFSELKKKKVVNILDGKVLGKITDLTFTYPEGKITDFIVSQGFCRDEYLVAICCINKIGDDAVLVSLKNGCETEESE